MKTLRVSLDDVVAARSAVMEAAIRTPLVRLNVWDVPAEIYLKLENLQPIGSFKIRGAANAIARMEAKALEDGIVTASAGNMAQAVAWNARRLRTACTVVAPDTTSDAKVRAVERLGGRVIKVPFDRWWQTFTDRSYPGVNGVFVHPFDDELVMAGNGTIGLEILEDLPDVDTVLIPWGGGGLASGIATAIKGLNPRVRAFAVEAETSTPLSASMAAGSVQTVSYTPSLIDGIGSKTVFADMLELAQALLDGTRVATLDETRGAIRLLAERNRVIAEGAGAVALAVALSGRAGTGKIACIVSGGNIDLDKLSAIVSPSPGTGEGRAASVPSPGTGEGQGGAALATSLEGRVALVTGGGRGIGRAIALALAGAGADVAISGRSMSHLDETARAIRDLGSRTVSIQNDVRKRAAVDAMVARVNAELGPPLILVNNAGIATSAKVAEITDEQWAETMDTNATGAFYCTRAVMPFMLKARWGRLINLASVASRAGAPYIAAYAASKHALLGLTRAVAAEVVLDGITANAICPGYVDSDMTTNNIARLHARTGRAADEIRMFMEKSSPQHRLMTIDEVASLALFLCGEEARGITGQGIVLDGGGIQGVINLSQEQNELGERARQVGREVRPIAEAGTPGRVNRRLVRALAEHGLLPRLFPHRAGGSHAANASALDLCLVREGLARESTLAENAVAIQALGAWPIVLAGRPEAVKRWIPPLASGDAVAAFAITDPGAGSDAGSVAMKAERDGDGYRLSGEKTFISNAPDADVYTVFARTTADAGSKGITAFVVPRDAPGVTGEAITLVSPHPIGRLEFDGVRVDASQMLGEVDRGFRIAMQTLDLFRPSVGAMVLGLADAALHAAVTHAGTRRQFGKPLREFQAVSHQLAEMATRIEAARLLVYSAAAAYDGGAPRVARRSAMAKLFATETAQFVVDAAIQIHGAVALEAGHPLAHLYLEVRAPRIYEGTSEIQREIIARDLFKEG